MSGHSKWSTIKRKKAANDSKRSALFTKIIRELTVAAKEGGAEPEGNPRLRMAIQQARKNNLPKDVMERAIYKGSGADGAQYLEAVYEGYGPHGVAFMLECTTDNINRTVANLRTHFNKHGGSLGVNGSVSYMFERKGVFYLLIDGIDEENLTQQMIEAGAQDLEKEGEQFIISCAFENYGAVSTRLQEMGIEPEESDLVRLPTTTVSVDEEAAVSILKLADRFDDDDDVQRVFYNLEVTEAIAKLSV